MCRRNISHSRESPPPRAGAAAGSGRGRGRWAAGADARPLAGSSRGSQPDRTSGPPGFSVQKPPRAGRFPAKARDCGPARGRRPRVPGRPWTSRVRLGLLGRVGGGRAGEWVGGGRPAGLADLVRGVERGCPGPGLGAGGVLAGPWMLALPGSTRGTPRPAGQWVCGWTPGHPGQVPSDNVDIW